MAVFRGKRHFQLARQKPKRSQTGSLVETKPRFSLSVDVEDWYMGIEIPQDKWGVFSPRLERGLDLLLEILAETGGKATFFVLGQAARKHPELVSKIHRQGHEIGSHGFSHSKVYSLKQADFAEEIRVTDDILSEIVGYRPICFRAPYFSITDQSLWALEILKENGYQIDASIYPGSNYRYGMEGSPREVHRLPNGLVEYPVSTFEIMGRTLGLGGAYLRILPLSMTQRQLRARLRANTPTTVYVHPWELDPSHPLVRFRLKAMLTHYVNLGSTQGKIRQILQEFGSASISDTLRDEGWIS